MTNLADVIYLPNTSDNGQPQLYLGSGIAVENSRWLDEHNIKYILNVGSPFGCNMNELWNVSNLKLLVYDEPWENITRFFDRCHNFIDEGFKNNVSVIVHCAYGVSRSSTIIISYFMKKYNWTYVMAYNHVKSYRNVISPNQGFIKQLQQYETDLRLNNYNSPFALCSTNGQYHELTSTTLIVDKENKKINNIELINWLEELLDPSKTFVDIGSADGAYTNILAQDCNDVHSFEPNINLYRQLNANLMLNNISNVKTYNSLPTAEITIDNICLVRINCDSSDETLHMLKILENNLISNEFPRIIINLDDTDTNYDQIQTFVSSIGAGLSSYKIFPINCYPNLKLISIV